MPPALTALIAALEERDGALREEGIYRVPGDVGDIQVLRAALERGDNPLVRLGAEWETSTVASCLKLLVKSFEEPVVPFGLDGECVSAAQGTSAEECVARLTVILRAGLPPRAPRCSAGSCRTSLGW